MVVLETTSLMLALGEKLDNLGVSDVRHVLLVIERCLLGLHFSTADYSGQGRQHHGQHGAAFKVIE